MFLNDKNLRLREWNEQNKHSSMGLHGGILSITKIIILLLLLFVLVNPASATWWNTSWSNRIDNTIPNGSRPYQISLNISNSTGTNNATTVFCNGKCNLNFTDIRFMLNNVTELPYWIENDNTNIGYVWVNITANGTVNMYYGNSFATSTSNRNTTFKSYNFNGYTEVDPSSKYTVNFTSVLVSGETGSLSNVYKNIGNIGNFSLSLDTTVTTMAADSAYYVMLADSNTNPSWATWAGGVNGIGYEYLSDSSGTIYLVKSVAGVITRSSAVDVTNGNKYYILLSRNSTTATLSVFTNPQKTIHATGSPLTMTVVSTQFPYLNIADNMIEYSGSRAYIINYPILRDYTYPEPVWVIWGLEQHLLFSFCSNPTSSSITTNSVTLNCNLINGSGTAWFQYSGSSNNYKFRSDYQTVSNDFSAKISGLPLQAGGTYYYQGLLLSNGTTYSSSQGVFTLPKVGQITDYDFDKHTEELAYNGLNISSSAITIPAVYTDIIGSIFWGIIFGFIFVMIWLRQEDVTIPSILGLLIGASLWSLMPPDWVSFAYSLTIVSFAGLMYSLIKSKT